MTTFPSLIPSTRTFTPGVYPHTAFTGMSGRSNRVRNSNVMLESQLRLTFMAITESQMLSILAHYNGRQGSFQSFPLPSQIWSGGTSSDYQLAGYGWIYKEPPTVEDLMCGGHNVELLLETVPPEGTALLGLSLTVRYLLAAGTAAAAAGAELSMTYGLADGQIDPAGINGTIVYSLSAGAVQKEEYDSDASAYIAAVEDADNQALEEAVKDAINDFVVGCKADGIWSAIKACCILAGARTLDGALVPLVGTAPTSYNFASGDYSRTTGLVGNGSTKYLDSNRNNSTDGQNSNHNAAYLTTAAAGVLMGAGPGTDSGTNVIALASGSPPTVATFRSRCSTGTAVTDTYSGLVGHSRSASGSFTIRVNGASTTASVTSQAARNENVLIFRRSGSGSPSYTASRVAFYSIGESLDLALLDARVATLISAIDAVV